MEYLSRLREALADERLGQNLLAAHAVVLVIVFVSLVVRRLLASGSARLGRLTDGHWLQPLAKQLVEHALRFLFWATLCAVTVTVVAGMAYHLAGRHIRHDLRRWFDAWTLEEVIQVGITLGILLIVAGGTWLVVRIVRRELPHVEKELARGLGTHCKEDSLRRWFLLLERFAVTACWLAGIWTAGQLIGLPRLANHVVGFVLTLLSALAVARLLILACPAVLRVLGELGDRKLANGPLHRYWEHITRLFPLGQRCFEATVWLAAASICAHSLHLIVGLDWYTTRVVLCLGLFFGTRVLIELSHALLNEAFGMYREDRPPDPKGRTLVPLLESLCQYVFYFGMGIFMLRAFEFDTAPILAGAGILGLAVGLGAQSLVTDVVSGFFILFEGQYLVGDYVQVGDAAGTIEEVGIRVTQIRDVYGKLFIIPNGQIKQVVNYSKGYVNAVVDMRIDRGNNLEAVFRAMTEAGQRLRKAHKEVLHDTEIHGIVDLGTSDMTVRAVTRVHPGTHVRMENEYRRLFKQVFDEEHEPARAKLAA